MITQQQIEEQAKAKSIRKVADYAPNSYKAGFIDGANWIIKRLLDEQRYRSTSA
jgi:hypothetical protein